MFGDPFSAASVTDISLTDRRNLQHAVMHQWLAFVDNDKQDIMTTIRCETMSHALNDPVARYTFIYTGASHHAFVSRVPFH